MSHLTTEQIEDLLGGAGEETREHLEQCEACRRRLAEARALRGRLQRAFESVAPPAGLASRLARAGQAPAGRRWHRALLARSGLAAAAMLLIAAASWLQWGVGNAAAADLFALHQGNIARVNGFHRKVLPEGIVELVSEEIGYAPAQPRLCQCCSLEGGRQGRLLERPAGTYLVKTPEGEVSVVIASAAPESLGMRRETHPSGATVWGLRAESCHAAAMSIDGMSYIVVGDADHLKLEDLLLRVVPKTHSPASWQAPCPFCGRPHGGLAEGR